jgi:hypothetical protein
VVIRGSSWCLGFYLPLIKGVQGADCVVTREGLSLLCARGEVEVWRSTVKMERCRYLESSQCKGACVNICKVREPASPRQLIFSKSCGGRRD